MSNGRIRCGDCLWLNRNITPNKCRVTDRKVDQGFYCPIAGSPAVLATMQSRDDLPKNVERLQKARREHRQNKGKPWKGVVPVI